MILRTNLHPSPRINKLLSQVMKLLLKKKYLRSLRQLCPIPLQIQLLSLNQLQLLSQKLTLLRKQPPPGVPSPSRSRATG